MKTPTHLKCVNLDPYRDDWEPPDGLTPGKVYRVTGASIRNHIGWRLAQFNIIDDAGEERRALGLNFKEPRSVRLSRKKKKRLVAIMANKWRYTSTLLAARGPSTSKALWNDLWIIATTVWERAK